MSDQTFGEFIAAHRSAAGLSALELGNRVGRSAATIRNWEQGRNVPTQAEVLTALSRALGVPEERVLEAAGIQGPERQNRLDRPRRPAPETDVHTSIPVVRGYRDDPGEMITYLIRGALTALGLIILLIILVWAVGGLLDQVGGLFAE